jgi:hypothetical protein
MTKDEQARARLAEIALEYATQFTELRDRERGLYQCSVRARAGFRDPSKGSWSAAGLTAAMEDAGLVVPAPGTEARRRSIALLDFVWQDRAGGLCHYPTEKLVAQAQPGDIIAWLQHPPPDPAGWRRGHVAVIVAVDDESLTTVSWGEGPKPGRVMMRRLWRDAKRDCDCMGYGMYGGATCECRGTGTVPRSSTILWRRPGGFYGIARPVAR